MTDNQTADSDLEPYRLDIRSADPIEPRVEALAALFPEAVRDGKIDVDQLAQLLGDVTDDGAERFGLSWPGKADAIRIAQRPSEGTLVPIKDESVDWDTTQNLVIEGENLEVLKLLQRSYHRMVKLIYIDPPYNTGKDFVYPDNFRDPLGNYLRFSGQVGEEGGRIRANVETSGRYHSSWLSMMWPRLHVARSLLADDGVLAVSIDDHEVASLRLLLNEIFGEENFIASVVWQKRYSRENRGAIGDAHEYLLLYARESAAFQAARGLIPPTAQQVEVYKNPNNDPRGRWRPVPMTAQGFRPNQMYEIETPSGARHVPPEGRCWSMTEPEYLKLREAGRIYFGKNGDAQPSVIRYLDEVDGFVPWTWWPAEEVGHTDESRKEIRRLFGTQAMFDTAKPVRLMQRLLHIAVPRDGIVLDFFAGSGTMGDAVLRLNADDGQNRRFILVQLDEPLDDETHTTIASLTRTRLAKVEGELGQELSLHADRRGGFRAFRLAASAHQPVSQLDSEDAQVSFEAEPEIDPSRDDEALLTEVLLARGFDLVTPTTWTHAGGLNVASVADGALVACFTREITVEQFEALVALDPAQLVLLEAAFGGNDEVKVNAIQHLKTVNAHRDTPIELLLL